MGQSKTNHRTSPENSGKQRPPGKMNAAKQSKTNAKGAKSSKLASHAAIGDRYRLEGTYERIRRVLLQAPNDGRLDQTLSYWVLPTDRRLPIALLDQTVRELIEMPLEALMQTPGIGQKKIVGLFDLLRRASKSEAPQEPFGLGNTSLDQKPNRYVDAAHAKGRSRGPSSASYLSEDKDDGLSALPFDPGLVSEEVWRSWCDTIERVGLAHQKLGRIAPTLRTLPTVIWQKELSEYSLKSLAEIRQLKTHGSKRVNAILEVFHAIHEAVSTSVLHERLELLIVPRFVPKITDWLIQANLSSASVSVDRFRKKLVRPLVDQIENDLGEPIADLVAQRLLIDAEPITVKQQAEKLQVTRARVYQLLDDCAQVMQVRWPEGRWLLRPLGSYQGVSRLDGDPQLLGIVHATSNLFFPEETVAELSVGKED